MKLTAATIRDLAPPAGSADTVFWDDSLPAFGLRVRASGARSWLVQYAHGGRTRRLTLGTPAILDVTKARTTARDVLAKARMGHDPAAEKAKARATARTEADETFGRMLPAYLERKRLEVRPRSLVEITRHLQKHAAPFHRLPVVSIGRRDVAALIGTITSANGATAAKHVRQSLSAYFLWLIGEGIIEASPVAHTNAPICNPPRDRVPDDADLRAIMRALGDDRHGRIMRLLLTLGLRRSEVADLKWSEVNLTENTIKLPAGRVKNAREHVVPLPRQAVKILRACQRERSDAETVFGGVDGLGFQNWHAAKRDLDARITELNGGVALEHWTAHDFRRSISTWLHDQGVDHLVCESIIGHKIGNAVARIYNHATHVDARRKALQRWADHLDKIVSDKRHVAVAR